MRAVRLFADDCVLYRTITSEEDATSLQKDLDALQRWENDWKMEFHPQKCQLLRITSKRNIIKHNYNIHGHILEEVDAAKYLGVTLHQSLSWNTHIRNITNKANKTRAFIQRNLHAAPPLAKENCYQALVRPILEYASSVWDPWTKSNIDVIEAVQRRSARFVKNDFGRYSSVDQMLKDLKWDTLRERRARAKGIIMFRIDLEQIAIPKDMFIATNRGRGHNKSLLVPYSRTELHQHSFIPDSIRIWNKLSQNLVDSPSVDGFRTGIEKVTLRK